MAYHGYMKVIASYAIQIFKSIKDKRPVKILEIGVDTGISLFAINNNLNLLGVPFEYTGVDIKIQPHIRPLDWAFLQRHDQNKVKLLEKNSLNYLSNCNEKFDIILIDGDHNYETVSRECKELRKISHKNTLFIFDDYHGKWATKDQFYNDEPGYEDNNLIMIKKSNLKKQGVKHAVDEFIEKDTNMISFILMQGEPICIIDKNNELVNIEN